MLRWLLDLNVPFQRRLLRELEELAIYNDKGIDWKGHSPAQVSASRKRHMARVAGLIRRIGEDSLPSEFLSAFHGGALLEDGTGKYVELVEQHVSIRSGGST
jgi:hypothetical protein